MDIATKVQTILNSSQANAQNLAVNAHYVLLLLLQIQRFLQQK